MRTPRFLFYCVLAVWVGSGCAWVPQTATLNPTPRIASSIAGRGVSLAVSVIDKRPSRNFGRRGVDSNNAAISTEQNVTAVLQEKIVAGLSQKGFSASAFEGQPGRLLTVEIRQIDYVAEMEYWRHTVQTEAVLAASMIKDGVKFEHLYSGKRKENTVESPTAKTNERLLNAAVSDALERLFEDERLIRFLAE